MANPTRQIALYGKGGIGKSTLASNISVALAQDGLKVMQIGCSPKSDSVTYLNGGKPLEKTVLDMTREKGTGEATVMECVAQGYHGIFLVEAGGPEPAEGCAGRGTAVALELLKQHRVPEQMGADFIIYDVIGDVVCGGFAQPIRAGFAEEVYMVSSGELMSLYSCNNICLAISELSRRGAKVAVAGLIDNMRGVEKEEELLEEFASRIGVPVVSHIPRSRHVQEAESRGETVLQAFPESDLAFSYRELGRRILEGMPRSVPNPLELQEIMDILREYQALD